MSPLDKTSNPRFVVNAPSHFPKKLLKKLKMNRNKLSIFDKDAVKLFQDICIDKSDFQLKLEEKFVKHHEKLEDPYQNELALSAQVSRISSAQKSITKTGQISSDDDDNKSGGESDYDPEEEELDLDCLNVTAENSMTAKMETEKSPEKPTKKTIEKQILCKYCSINVPQSSYRSHFKTPEHTANFKNYKPTIESKRDPTLKDKIDNIDIETLPDDFQTRLTKYDIQRSQKLFLRNKSNDLLLSIYRHIICNKGEFPTHVELINRLRKLQSDVNSKVLILLHAGGHFAIALYQNGNCIKHKTHRAYIVRGKAGGVQSQADKRQGAHKSVGAQLRRTNQVHFEEKISELLAEWKNNGDFNNTDLKCLHLPHYAKKLYFNDKAFSKDDPSIRSIPFSTVKPGLAEANRVFNELFSVAIYRRDLEIADAEGKNKINRDKTTVDLETLEQAQNKLKKSNPNVEVLKQEDIIDNSKKRKEEYAEKNKQIVWSESSTDEEYQNTEVRPSFSVDGNMAIHNALESMMPDKKFFKRQRRERQNSDNLDEGEIEISKLQISRSSSVNSKDSGSRSRKTSEKETNDDLSVFQICSCGKKEDLNQFNQLIPSFIWVNQPLDGQGRYPLHAATRAGNIEIIKELLYNHNANPELKDKSNQTPYEIAKNKVIRNVFRVFRYDFPDRYDWKICKVDDPISIGDLEDKKSASKSAKKKNAKKKKEAAKKAAEAEQQQQKSCPSPSSSAKSPTKSKKMMEMGNAAEERAKRLAAIEKRLGKKI